ncbi:hypothetical protein [Vibrio taketomensis]|uniref:hypothetical protein n=1 Tax=Vibrio taketomensis TaxID=2572923 RepID=UPI00138A2068|nr:hypothetical protein [Vibrio taketomensis]
MNENTGRSLIAQFSTDNIQNALKTRIKMEECFEDIQLGMVLSVFMNHSFKQTPD